MVNPHSVEDPVLFHAINNAFGTIAREMGVIVSHTAYSPLLARSSGATGDTDGAVLDAEGHLIAGDGSTIIHLASLPIGLKFVLAEFPLDKVAEGDIFINNHAHKGAIHGNDTMVFQPVFVNGAVAYWSAVMAHITDVGGISPGGISVGATSVFAEGLLIPPMKLRDAGELNAPLLDLIAANSRQPFETRGDVLALVAASNVGADRIRGLLEHHDASRVASVVDELMSYSERRVRAAVSAMPDGTYEAESWVDDDGIDLDRHYKVRASVTIEGDSLTVDFDGTSAQARGSINSSFSQTITGVTYAIRVYVGDIPLNEGFWRAVDIRLPHGSVVNPQYPAACNTRTAGTLPSVVEAVMWALSQAAPTVGIVAGAGVPDVHAMNPARSVDGRAGEYWLHFEAEWGGGGARNTCDGVDAGGTTMMGGHGGLISAEATEIMYELRCEHFRLRPDTGGAGRFRGGLGVEKNIRFLCDSVVSARNDRWAFPPAGIAGGKAGSPGAYVLNPGRDGERALASKFAEREVSKGDVISFRTMGGGGYGPPADRDPDVVLEDVRCGRVSVAAAARQYGVVIVTNAHGEPVLVDVDATKRRREEWLDD
jgi:N-methylhydantoinase B